MGLERRGNGTVVYILKWAYGTIDTALLRTEVSGVGLAWEQMV